jgi:hypothetical protein
VLKPPAQGQTVVNPFQQGFWPVKGKHFPRARLRITAIRKTGDDTGAFINEWQRVAVVNPFQLCTSIAAGLFFNRGDFMTPVFGLRFKDTDGPFINK